MSKKPVNLVKLRGKRSELNGAWLFTLWPCSVPPMQFIVVRGPFEDDVMQLGAMFEDSVILITLDWKTPGIIQIQENEDLNPNRIKTELCLEFDERAWLWFGIAQALAYGETNPDYLAAAANYVYGCFALRYHGDQLMYEMQTRLSNCEGLYNERKGRSYQAGRDRRAKRGKKSYKQSDDER